MKKEDEILLKINSLETMIEKIYREILEIKRENDDKSLEQFHIMTRLENIADFIKDRYDIVVEEKEKFEVQKMENDNLM